MRGVYVHEYESLRSIEPGGERWMDEVIERRAVEGIDGCGFYVSPDDWHLSIYLPFKPSSSRSNRSTQSLSMGETLPRSPRSREDGRSNEGRVHKRKIDRSIDRNLKIPSRRMMLTFFGHRFDGPTPTHLPTHITSLVQRLPRSSFIVLRRSISLRPRADDG